MRRRLPGRRLFLLGSYGFSYPAHAASELAHRSMGIVFGMPIETDVAFSLAGYQGRTQDGRATVQRFHRGERLKRSGRLLAICWGAALGTAFIPVAHFLLVPGFLLGGVFAAGRRVREHERILDARGTCPDCNHHQAFTIDSGWSFPGTLACRSCSRALTARLNGTGS